MTIKNITLSILVLGYTFSLNSSPILNYTTNPFMDAINEFRYFPSYNSSWTNEHKQSQQFNYAKLLGSDNKITISVGIAQSENDLFEYEDHLAPSSHHLDLYKIVRLLESDPYNFDCFFEPQCTSSNLDECGEVCEKDFFNKDYGTYTVVIKLFTSSVENPLSRYITALKDDDIVIYQGHSRYGTGPDFDRIDTFKENLFFTDHSRYKSYDAFENFKALHPGISTNNLEPVFDELGSIEKEQIVKIPQRIYFGKNKSLTLPNGNIYYPQSNQFIDQLLLNPSKYQIWAFNTCKTNRYIDDLKEKLSSEKYHNLDFLFTHCLSQLRQQSYSTWALIVGISQLKSKFEIMHNIHANEYKCNEGVHDSKTKHLKCGAKTYVIDTISTFHNPVSDLFRKDMSHGTHIYDSFLCQYYQARETLIGFKEPLIFTNSTSNGNELIRTYLRNFGYGYLGDISNNTFTRAEIDALKNFYATKGTSINSPINGDQVLSDIREHLILNKKSLDSLHYKNYLREKTDPQETRNHYDRAKKWVDGLLVKINKYFEN